MELFVTSCGCQQMTASLQYKGQNVEIVVNAFASDKVPRADGEQLLVQAICESVCVFSEPYVTLHFMVNLFRPCLLQGYGFEFYDAWEEITRYAGSGLSVKPYYIYPERSPPSQLSSEQGSALPPQRFPSQDSSEKGSALKNLTRKPETKSTPTYKKRHLPNDLPRHEPRPKFPCCIIGSDDPRKVIQSLKGGIKESFTHHEFEHDPESDDAQTPYIVSGPVRVKYYDYGLLT